MIKCDHCGFGFADHRADASCPTEGCPHMKRRLLSREDIRDLDEALRRSTAFQYDIKE